MTAEQAYREGFCKMSEDMGVNPDFLMKVSSDGSILDSIAQVYRNMDPSTRRAILGGLLTGTGTYLMSNGDAGDRTLKGIAGGVLGGTGVYGLSRAGAIDGILDALYNTSRSMKRNI